MRADKANPIVELTTVSVTNAGRIVKQSERDDEVKKVERRLKLWAKRQHQINARILNAFLALRRRGKTAITVDDVRVEYAADKFEGNFEQMANFGEQNRGKVFDRTIDGTVEIWKHVSRAVDEYEMKVAKLQSKMKTDSISDAEWQVRRDLAACYRLFVRFGWTDLIFTHLSARVPGEPTHYLINPYGLLFDEVTAANLIKVDFDGNVIKGDYPYNDAGHAIHTAILRARPDMNAVLHSHTRAGMAVSTMRCGLLPLSQQASEVGGLVSYHDYDLATDNEAECEALGRDLGDKWLMIMRNHGLLSAGRTVAEAFYHLYVLENACKVQVDVLACGEDYVTPSADAIAAIAGYATPPDDAPADFVTRSWDALMRQLARDGVRYE